MALAALVLGYVFYGRKVSDWFDADLKMTTPAVELNDGVDFVPAKHWTVLFGHHFASIAGAAPIIGPVIACILWGWLPAVLWIVLGGIFFGAAHDYCALMCSAENKGRSIGSLSESLLGKPAKIVFSIFVLLTLILIVAVFAAAAGKTLTAKPEVVIPTFGLIPVAILIGILMYRVGLPLALNTGIGLVFLFGLIVLGYYVPVKLPVADPARWWTIILLIYAMTAAVLPVSFLLQPRDHLAAGVLFAGMFLGFAGIVVSRAPIQAPAFIAFDGAGEGWMWPMMFVNIACGAISGFHSLIASGTTSKQLSSMRDGRRIGYGAMITESGLSILAVIAVIAGLYWKTAPAGGEGYVYQDFMAKADVIGAFGAGYGRLTTPILGGFGVLVGITMLKTFIMTTLDSATRITRYLCSELLGETFGIKLMKNRYAATLLIGICSGTLALSNPKAIWPLFGSSNQLIAGMVLTIAALYLLSRGRTWLFAAVPAVLVFVTAIGALIYKLVGFIRPADGGVPNIMLIVVDIILILLGLFVAFKAVSTFANALHRRKT